MRRLLPTILAAVPAVLCLSAAAQTPEPSLRIAAPTEGTFVSGPTRLVAMIDPPAAATGVTQVTFFADGHQVCVINRAPFECDWDAGDRMIDHQIRAVASLKSGRRLVQSVRTQGLQYSEDVDVDVVQVTAVVTSGDGRFVQGLTKNDFRVFEDDRPQPITSFGSEDIPLELVAAIDVSSSMTDALPHVKAAAKQFLGGLQATDNATLLSFNENIFTVAPRGANAEARVRAIDRMQPWGGTALYDVIIRALELVGRRAGRHSVVLFSDGDDQSSHAPLNAALARAEGSDATIYAIGQGRAVRASDLQRILKQLSDKSGGRAFFTESPTRLGEIFDEILEDLRHQYLLKYPAPSNQRDGVFHRIRVEVSSGKYHVRARDGYRLERK